MSTTPFLETMMSMLVGVRSSPSVGISRWQNRSTRSLTSMLASIIRWQIRTLPKRSERRFSR